MNVKVVGTTFNNEDGSSRRENIIRMSENSPIELIRDPYNQYDSNAVKVVVIQNGEQLQIGNLPKELAAQLSPRMRRRETFKAKVVACGLYMDRPYCEIEIFGI